jgi:glyoxylase-like metal-dependent hydrolase (beta-lactamase superfamily II)
MKELFANTWAETDQGVRIFLLAGREKALLIDTGMTGLDLHAITSLHTDLPLQLLNTHADRDHIAGNAQFQEFYMHPSEAAFYRNVQHGSGRLLPVFDGDLIDLGGRTLEIIHLPGHTPGSITVLDWENRCLIGGDPIQEDGNIYMFGDHRNMDAYIAGLERLLEHGDFDFIYPSHAKEKVSRDVIPELIDGAKDILAGKIPGKEIEVHGKKVTSCDVGVSRFLCELPH